MGSLAFGGGMFVLRGNDIHVQSADGVSWTMLGQDVTRQIAGNVTFAADRFVTWTASESKVLVWTGAAWQSVDLPGTPSYWMSDLRAVNGSFVGVTRYDCCLGEDPSAVRWGRVTSTDGLTWVGVEQGLTVQQQVPLIDNGSACVAFRGSDVMGGGTCASAHVTFSEAGFLPYQAAYAGGVYVVTGSAGLLSSTNGLTWTKSVWSH